MREWKSGVFVDARSGHGVPAVEMGPPGLIQDSNSELSRSAMGRKIHVTRNPAFSHRPVADAGQKAFHCLFLGQGPGPSYVNGRDGREGITN